MVEIRSPLIASGTKNNSQVLIFFLRMSDYTKPTAAAYYSGDKEVDDAGRHSTVICGSISSFFGDMALAN
jgi:hypothetical protein